MLSIIKHEIKINFKTFLIWAITVAGLSFACILLFADMKEGMGNLADNFASMGSFSEAFGMKTLSIATINGYFATEIGTIHGLGSGMYAAILAATILSKEEDGHTGEFLFSLPVTRFEVVSAKLIVLFINILGFTVFCAMIYMAGFVILGDSISIKPFIYFMVMQFIMNIEIGAICFLLSAFNRKNKLGIGLGIALLCYVFDLIARVSPSVKKMILVGPYSYANAPEIFSKNEIYVSALVIGVVVSIACLIFAFWRYLSRDLAS